MKMKKRERNKQKTNDFFSCFYLFDSSQREVFSTPQSDERGGVEKHRFGMPDGLRLLGLGISLAAEAVQGAALALEAWRLRPGA